jgi:hypothetical protein
MPALPPWRGLPARPATGYQAGRCGRRVHGTDGSGSFWPLGIACAGVVVMYLLGVVGLVGHAPSLTSPLGMVEAEALPSDRVLWSRSSTVGWPPPTSPAASPWTSTVVVSQWCQRMWAAGGRRSPLFHRLLSQHSAPSTPRSSSRLRFQSLPLFRGLRLSLRGSALLCPLQVTLTTLQDSREGTDCGVAPPSRRDTPLQHPRSPRSTGSLLRGSLAITTAGLASASRR